MRYTYVFLFITMVIFAPVVSAADTQSFTSRELIEMANSINGRKVAYRGEAVTAIMNRGSHSWVNLNDGSNAIGVWCKTDDLRDVKSLGGYKSKGDVLEVVGIFNRACSIHRGELDIHAESVKVISAGFPVEERISTKRIKVAIAFFLLAIVAIIVLRKRI